MVGSVRGSTHTRGWGAWAPSGAQGSFRGIRRLISRPADAGGGVRGALVAPETCPTTAGPGSFPDAAVRVLGVRGGCCGRSPGITPRPRRRFRRTGVPDHPETGHPTHLGPAPLPHSHPAAPAASIMRLTAHHARFVPANLMINGEVEAADGRPAPEAGPERMSPVSVEGRAGDLGTERPPEGRARTKISIRRQRRHRRGANLTRSGAPTTTEILEGKGPHRGRNPPRSPAGCRAR